MKHPPKPCKQCGAIYKPKGATTKYCSRTCAGTGSAAEREGAAQRKGKRAPAHKVTSVAIKLAPPCQCIGGSITTRSLDVGADYRTVWTCYRCGRATR